MSKVLEWREIEAITRREFLIGAGGLLALGAVGCGSGEEGGGETTGEALTIEHKFGATEILGAPERVATVGYNESDFVLALGVAHVGVRDFIGPFQEEDRPWAREEIGDSQPELVGGEEVNFEAIAALEPDLILAIYSFIGQEEYDLLAGIAPTVAQPAEYEDGGTPWQEQMLITGRALGTEQRAQEVVDEVEGHFDEEREQNPQFEGQVAAIIFFFDGEYSLLAPEDLRTLLFTSLGFRLPEPGPISAERVDLLDQDMIVFLGADREVLESDELIQNLSAVQEGRAVYFGGFETDFAGALGYSSPLSLPFALDEAVPELAEATEGTA